VAANRRSTPAADGSYYDGGYVYGLGTTYPTTPGAVGIVAGTQATGYAAWNFNPDASFNAPGAVIAFSMVKSNGGRVLSTGATASTGDGRLTCGVYDTTQGVGVGFLCYPGGTERYIAPLDSTGAYIEGSWWFGLNSDFTILCYTNITAFNGSGAGLHQYGLYCTSAAYSTGNQFAFGWSSVVSGYATITIDNGGAVYALASTSDLRVKQDIAPSRLDCLKLVKSLSLVEYRRRDIADPWKLREARAKNEAPLIRVGMIAQQIAKLFPEGVIEGDDFDDHLGRVWGLDHNNLIALLLGAVQEMAREVEALKAT
jgi:hypothetical protein